MNALIQDNRCSFFLSTRLLILTILHALRLCCSLTTTALHSFLTNTLLYDIRALIARCFDSFANLVKPFTPSCYPVSCPVIWLFSLYWQPYLLNSEVHILQFSRNERRNTLLLLLSVQAIKTMHMPGLRNTSNINDHGLTLLVASPMVQL